MKGRQTIGPLGEMIQRAQQQDVRFVPCAQLHVMLDGESIPPGRGTPPPPLP